MKFLGDKSVEHDVGSLPARGVWIEINRGGWKRAAGESLPARGVWIEIWDGILKPTAMEVAPRKGSVD